MNDKIENANRSGLATLDDAARYFGCSRRHLERMVASGEVQVVRLRKLIRLDLDAVREQLLDCRGARA